MVSAIFIDLQLFYILSRITPEYNNPSITMSKSPLNTTIPQLPWVNHPWIQQSLNYWILLKYCSLKSNHLIDQERLALYLLYYYTTVYLQQMSRGYSVAEFDMKWRHWQDDVQRRLEEREFATNLKLKTVCRVYNYFLRL
jgi:hypothetical protein